MHDKLQLVTLEHLEQLVQLFLELLLAFRSIDSLCGTLLFADGGRYEGDFVNGRMQGRGQRVWSNGARYDGEWSNDVANGYGTQAAADGQVFTGTWVNGCYRDGSRWATAGVSAQSCGFQ